LSGKVKYLGITFHRKLLWDEHINNIANKMLARISELYLLLGYYSNVSHVIKFQFYMACINPATGYGCEDWAYIYKSIYI
jgi:hypothetical protein